MKLVSIKNTSKFSLLLFAATAMYGCKKNENSNEQHEYKNIAMEAAACGVEVVEIEEVKKHLSLKEDQLEYAKKLGKINKVAFSELYIQYQRINDMIEFLNKTKLKNGTNEFIDSKLEYFNDEKNIILKVISEMKRNDTLVSIDTNHPNKKPILNTFDANKKTIQVIDTVTKKVDIHKLNENDLQKLISYDDIINKSLTSKFSTGKLTKVKKFAFKGVEKFASGANKYNVLMNFVTMPNTLSNINTSFQNGNYSTGIRDSLHFSANNADLFLDLYKASKGAAYWNGHQNTFKNITKLQIALNLASAGFEVYNAVELFKAASLETDPYKKQDYLVNASLNTASAVTSVGTALLLPLSAKAGPIGAAVGFSIMFSQGTYNAVRTADELRRLGFAENYAVPRAVETFFGLYQIEKDLKVKTKKTALHIQDSYIPEIMKKNNDLFFADILKNSYSNLYFINKIIYPKIDLYVPYTNYKYIYDHDEISSYTTTTETRLIKNEDHICLTNNSYFAEKSDSLENLHNISIQKYSSNLELKSASKEVPTPEPIHKKYYSMSESHYSINASVRKDLSFSYPNPTEPCPIVNKNTNMLSKQAQLSAEQNNLLANIQENKKANLYLVGYGDQGRHGNMIHTIVAERNSINLFNIHPATYLAHIEGGEKDDIFEFYDEIQNKIQDKGYIDGNKGIDTVNLQAFIGKSTTISLDQNIKVTSNLPEFRNIENIVGSNQSDTIHGNNQNNVFFGNNGDDKLFGYDGNDVLYSGKGKDFLAGGSKSDTYVILKTDLYNSGISNLSENLDKIETGLTTIDTEIKRINIAKNEIKSKINEIKNYRESYFRSANYSPDIYLPSIKYFDYVHLDFNEVAKNFKINIDDIRKSIINIEDNIKDGKVFGDLNEIKQKLNSFNTINAEYEALIKNLESIVRLENENGHFWVSDRINSYEVELAKLIQQDNFSSILVDIQKKYTSFKSEIQSINENYKKNLDGIKVIDNYDSSFNSQTDSFDAIMTDIDNLIAKRIDNNLILGIYIDNKFIPAIKVSNYFSGEKYQHLLISDMKGNILTSKSGNLFDQITLNENESENKDEIKTKIDTYKVKPENNNVIMADINSTNNIKNVIGTDKSDVIKGDSKDNILYGEGGLDKIYGNQGDDTIVINFDSGSDVNQKYTLMNKLFFDGNVPEINSFVNGGEGHDTYIFNLNNTSKENTIFFSIIENEDIHKKIDNLVINDKENSIKKIKFYKFTDLKYKKKHLKIELIDNSLNNSYVILVKNWFEEQKNQHLQIQLGENFSLSDGILNQITNILNGKEKVDFTVDLDSDKSEIYVNTYNVINYARTSDTIKFNRLNKEKSESSKVTLKFGRINNDLYIHFLEGRINYSYISIKDFFYWREVVREEFQVKIDDEIVMSNEKFDLLTDELMDGEVTQIFN